MENGRVLRLVASFGLLLFFESGCKKKAPPPAPPLKVEVIKVVPQDVPIYKEWVGTMEGYVNAQIRAQVSGYLLSQNYIEGSAVKAGDLLFQIDPRPFQALVDQAKAKTGQDQAQYIKTQLDVKRFTPLAKDGAVSQQELDDAIQANLVAEAAVKADEAAAEAAILNLNFTKVLSPISGIAGTALAQIGDLVGPSGSVLTTVSTIDPMRVYFSVSEQVYLEYRKRFPSAETRMENQASIQFELILADGSVYPYPGKFFYENRQVELTTGSIQLAALFPNPESILRPGGYARVRAKTETRKGAFLVPQRAVTELQGSFQVAVVDDQKKVHVKSVQVGEQVNSNWIIEKGLATNDTLIVEGTQRVKEGTVVDPQPYQPNSSANSGSATNSSAGK